MTKEIDTGLERLAEAFVLSDGSLPTMPRLVTPFFQDVFGCIYISVMFF